MGMRSFDSSLYRVGELAKYVAWRARGSGRKIVFITTGRRESYAPCRLFPDPPRDGIIRTSPGQECSEDKGALPGTRGVLLYLGAKMAGFILCNYAHVVT